MKKIRLFLIGAFVLALSCLSSCDMLGNTSSSSNLISSNSSTSISSNSTSSSSSHKHTWDTGTVTKKAICTEAGMKVFTCESCKETKVEVISATGHTKVIDEAVEPTCTTVGLTNGSHCSVCNEVLAVQETINAIGHKEVVDEAIEPTCTTSGLTEGKHCSVCNDIIIEQKEISAQHIYVNGSCKMCGATEGLQYTLVDGGYSISQGSTKNNENIVIPSCYNGLPVTSIGDFAFAGCSSLVSITIPDSVTSIGIGAFCDCYSLESITIPKSVTSIGEEAFCRCSSLKGIIIPNSVTSIRLSTFYECRSLISIKISKSVTSIEYAAFKGCSSLKYVYYTGAKKQWNSIAIAPSNDSLTSANIHYNYIPE